MSRKHLRIAIGVVLVLSIFSWTNDNLAQDKVVPIPVNPQAPTIASILPQGLQRGTSLDVTITGTNLGGTLAVWTSFPAQVTIPTDANNGKDETKLRVKLETAKDIPMGFGAIRVSTPKGVSNAKVFCIDDLPQVLETDANRTKATPQAVPIPCVVAGRADPEVNDYFKISVKPGQRVSFEILGRRLGSAFDPQLSLLDPKTGRELPNGHSNDAPGLQTDPRLTYTFKEGGEYLVEVRDVMYRGGADYGYRLRIGDFPCATTPMPLAVRRGSQARISFAGPFVEGVVPVDVFVPTEATVDSVSVTPRGANGLSGWPVVLQVSDVEEIQEQEPNNEAAKATRLPIPSGVSARFQESGDVDYFAFSAKKGQRLILEAQTQELSSPTEVYMVVRDAKGAQVAASNPAAAPRVDFTPPADGDYTLMVEHLLYWGGPTETYHFTIRPFQAGFDFNVSLDRFDVPQGAMTSVPVQVTRRDYTGPIDVTVLAPPGVYGRVVIPAGQNVATLFVEATPDAVVGGEPLKLQASAVVNGKLVAVPANVRTYLSGAMANLSHPPRALTTQLAIGVTDKPPFNLVARLDNPEAIRGGTAPVTLTLQRTASFKEEVALAPIGFPANVTSSFKTIPAGQTEAKGTITAAANANLGRYVVSFQAKGKSSGREFTVVAAPQSLTLATAFDLKVEPAQVKLQPNTKAKVKVTATRRGGHQSPIKVQARNLPANVTAAEVTIPQGQNSVEVELSAAANAAPGDKADVNLLGSTDAPNKEQNASANFTVSVPAPPFDLKVEPNPVKVAQGGKLKIKVIVTRKGYTGPLTVELKNLPAMVTAAKATIPANQNEAVVEIVVDEKAAPGDKADVQALGTATEAGMQPNSSPNFTLSVGKK